MRTIETHIDDDGEILVVGLWEPAEKGDRGPHGEPLSPDLEERLTITETYQNGLEIELPDGLENTALEALREKVNEMIER